MTTYIYAKAFYFEDEVKGPGYLPILDNGTFGAFQTEKPESALRLSTTATIVLLLVLLIHIFTDSKALTSWITT